MQTRWIAIVALAACAEAPGGDDEGDVQTQSASTTVATFQDPRDTMLDGGAPNTEHGGETALSADGDDDQEMLLDWDVSSIPATATIDAVTITLEVSDKSSDSFSLYEAKRAWSASHATWREADVGASWSVAGGRGASDRGATALGTFSAPSTGSVTIALNASGVALVQRWVAAPDSNLGLFLDGPGSTNRLEVRSGEYGRKSKRPKLTVTWHAGSAGTYKGACDGSYGVMIDATHFLSGSDETQGARLYTRGASGTAQKTIDLSSGLGLATSAEADLEDAARIGDRVYALGSHGRTKDGELDRARYRFFAMDVAGAAPNISLSVAGYTTTLLDRMLVAANWTAPDSAVIQTLTAASRLSVATDANLAPKVNGANIEGLAWAPTTARPSQLMIGFRNPLQGSRAIVVSLLNADAVITGATPRFGEASLLDLGGLGIRAMAWSPVHDAVLLVAGGKDEGGGFALYKWVPGSAPVLVQSLTGLAANTYPESIVVYPNSRDVQLVFDQGSRTIGGEACKDLSSSSQWTSDLIVHVP